MKKFWTSIILWLCLSGLLFCQTTSSHINQIHDIQIHSSSFNFAIIGDRTGEGSDPWTVFDAGIQAINQKKPDFVVMIGDIIQGGAHGSLAIQTRWREALMHLEKLNGPLFLIPGNHDIDNQAGYDAWQNTFGKTYFRFTAGNHLFLFLNTEENRAGNGPGLGRKQMSFVKATFDSVHISGQIFIFMHRPPWLEKGYLNDQWTEIEAILKGRRFSLITGHLHVLGEKIEAGNRYLIVGPTGGKMRLARNPDLGMIQHYTWVDVENDTSYIQFIENETLYTEEAAINAYKRGIRTLRFLMSQ